MNEPVIIINGRQLTEGQAMAMRVAINCFHSEHVQNPLLLGEDEHGRFMTKAYADRASEIINLMNK